jgi:hypothetical protein
MIKLTEFQEWVQVIYGNNGVCDVRSESEILIKNVINNTLQHRFNEQVEDVHERQEQKLDMRELSITALTGESSQELINNALVNAYRELILEELEIIEEYEEDLALELLEAQHDGLEQAKREQAAKL